MTFWIASAAGVLPSFRHDWDFCTTSARNSFEASVEASVAAASETQLLGVICVGRLHCCDRQSSTCWGAPET
jgi:hypothetical protein